MNQLNPELAAYIARRINEFDRIPGDRRSALQGLADFVESQRRETGAVRLIFICTHNSRRSHLSQIWAQAAASYYGIAGVETFSGGTEATAFNPRAVAAAQAAGFEITRTDDGDNPVYRVRFAADADPLECFSKEYGHPANPGEGFGAVMTCSSAEAACPIVFGAARRMSIQYEDPKAYDGTDEETAQYRARCRQIAREMLFAFSRVKNPAQRSTSEP